MVHLRRILIFIPLLSLSLSSVADISRGDEFKAEELFKLCNSGTTKEAECIAFIKGARSGMTAQRLFMGMNFIRDNITPPKEVGMHIAIESFCLPRDISDRDMKETVVSFLKKMSQDQRQANAGFSVLMAFNSAYPCSKKDFENFK